MLVPLWLKGNVSRETQGYQNCPKYNNSLKTFSYAVWKNLAMHQSDFTFKYLLKSLKYQCKLVPEEVKKTS